MVAVFLLAYLLPFEALPASGKVSTASVLGWQLGLARAVGAIVFSVIIGLSMHLIFRKEAARHAGSQFVAPEEDQDRPLWQTVLYFAAMIGVLVFANWGRLGEDGIAATIWAAKWYLTGGSLVGLTVMLALWFKRPRISDYGVLMTPGLVIDGQVKFSGKVPDDAKLRAILSE